MEERRTCKHCKQSIAKNDYWRHIQDKHPRKIEKDASNLIQLYGDYLILGMELDTVIEAINTTYNVDIQKIINYKNHRANQNAILFFYGIFGLFYAISIIFHNFISLPGWTVTIFIHEITKMVEIEIPVADLIDVILLGIGFSISSHWAFELIPNKMKNISSGITEGFTIGKNLFNFGIYTQFFTTFYDIYIEGLLNEGGVIETGSILWNFTIVIHYWNGTVIPYVIATGLYLLILTFMILEAKSKDKGDYTNKFIIFLCAFVGLEIAYEFSQNMTAAIFFLVSIVYIIIAFIIILKNKKQFARKSFTSATIFVMLGYIVFILIYVLFTGLNVNFPYIHPPTDFGIGLMNI